MSFKINILELIINNNYDLYKTYNDIKLFIKNNNNSNDGGDDFKEYDHFDTALIVFLIHLCDEITTEYDDYIAFDSFIYFYDSELLFKSMEKFDEIFKKSTILENQELMVYIFSKYNDMIDKFITYFSEQLFYRQELAERLIAGLFKKTCSGFIKVLKSRKNEKIYKKVLKWDNLGLVKSRDRNGLFSILSILEQDNVEYFNIIFEDILFNDDYDDDPNSLDTDEKHRILWRMICKYDSVEITDSILRHNYLLNGEDHTCTMKSKDLKISVLDILKFTAFAFSCEILKILFHYFPKLSDSIKPTPIKEIKGLVPLVGESSKFSISSGSIKLLKSGLSFQYLEEVDDEEIKKTINYLRLLSKERIHIDTEFDSSEKLNIHYCFYKGELDRYEEQPWSILYQAMDYGLILTIEALLNIVGDDEKILIQLDQLISNQEYVYLIKYNLSSVVELIRNESVLLPKLSDNITFCIATLCSEEVLENYMKRYIIDPFFKFSIKDIIRFDSEFSNAFYRRSELVQEYIESGAKEITIIDFVKIILGEKSVCFLNLEKQHLDNATKLLKELENEEKIKKQKEKEKKQKLKLKQQQQQEKQQQKQQEKQQQQQQKQQEKEKLDNNKQQDQQQQKQKGNKNNQQQRKEQKQQPKQQQHDQHKERLDNNKKQQDQQQQELNVTKLKKQQENRKKIILEENEIQEEAEKELVIDYNKLLGGDKKQQNKLTVNQQQLKEIEVNEKSLPLLQQQQQKNNHVELIQKSMSNIETTDNISDKKQVKKNQKAAAVIIDKSDPDFFEIGKFQFIRNDSNILGRGSNGTLVYKGLWSDRVPVAIKQMHKAFNPNINKEVDALIELKSKNCSHLVKYIDKEEDKTSVYLGLTLCDGSLQQLADSGKLSEFLIKRKPLEIGDNNEPSPSSPTDTAAAEPESRILNLLKDIVSGVEFLHSHDMVHNDLNPRNILVLDGRFLISDLGLCKMEVESSFSYTMHVPTGQGGYHPIEVLQEGKRKTKAVDIFSLGCIFYFLLSNGNHPFGNDKIYRMVNILTDKIMMDTLLLSSNPLAYHLIRSMISKDESSRPSIQNVSNHPLFWNFTKKFKFIEAALHLTREPSNNNDNSKLSILLNQDTNSNSSSTPFLKQPWNQLVDLAELIISTTPITSKKNQPPSSQPSGGVYQFDQVKDLIRFIRNTITHCIDIKRIITTQQQHNNNNASSTTLSNYKELLQVLSNQTTVLSYFESKLPNLIYHLYEQLKSYSKDYDYLNVFYQYK